MISKIYGYTSTQKQNRNQTSFKQIQIKCITTSPAPNIVVKPVSDLVKIGQIADIVANSRNMFTINPSASRTILSSNGKSLYRGIFLPKDESTQKSVVVSAISGLVDGKTSKLLRLDYITKLPSGKTCIYEITNDDVLSPIFRRLETDYGDAGQALERINQPSIILDDKIELALRHEFHNRLTDKQISILSFDIKKGEVPGAFKNGAIITFYPKGSLKNRFPHITIEYRDEKGKFENKPLVIKSNDDNYDTPFRITAQALTNRILQLFEKGKPHPNVQDLEQLRTFILKSSSTQ